MTEYLPNFGRPEGVLGPVGLWSYVDRDGRILDLNLNVVRCRALRTYHPSPRDQHWSLSWHLGTTEDGDPVHRRIHITREPGADHLTNWGPITVTVDSVTVAETHVIPLGRTDFKQRVVIEEIASRTPVCKPDGEWNCQNWLETVLDEMVEKGVLPGDVVQAALQQARLVQPIPFQP
ncbi:hypothetical protein CCMSSC00406_0001644 [Pleurotus cornucopiae]|uniref:Uncharacterized protein n=1 Tax=Pleurotus cornucopiae TaxID=5321 RepID=A0ACB7IP26_PLECO|nr:hypothetical protein CCMSSC00406_0001644 [Pleurotus cornucopiae]